MLITHTLCAAPYTSPKTSVLPSQPTLNPCPTLSTHPKPLSYPVNPPVTPRHMLDI